MEFSLKELSIILDNYMINVILLGNSLFPLLSDLSSLLYVKIWSITFTQETEPSTGWPFTQTTYLPTISRYVQTGQLTNAVMQRPKIKSGRLRRLKR